VHGARAGTMSSIVQNIGIFFTYRYAQPDREREREREEREK
jgi:hypothetical protein